MAALTWTWLGESVSVSVGRRIGQGDNARDGESTRMGERYEPALNSLPLGNAADFP
jgi:hypothetical protein